MKIKCGYSIFFLFFSFASIGQNNKNLDTIRGNCIYGDNNHSAAVCADFQKKNRSFETNTEAYTSIIKLLKPIGLKPNFVIVPCDNINNCAAIVWSDGLRYIIYDKKFMKSISMSANTNWTNLSILAHEIGHHLNGHTLVSTNLSDSRQEELEADEFSGFILAKMGATLDQAQAAMKSINHPSCSDDIHYTHPCLLKRLTAIEKGWSDASKQQHTIPLPQKNNVTLSTPKLTSPSSNFRSDNYPRNIVLQWESVANASAYEVDIEILVPPTNQWVNLNEHFLKFRNQKYYEQIVKDKNVTFLSFTGVGAQPHRWRVRAINEEGLNSPYSEWYYLFFRR